MSKKDKLLASAQKNVTKGQLPRAIKDYEKLIDLDSQDIRCRQKLADLYSRNRQVEEALEQFSFVAGHYADKGFYLKAIAVYKQMQKLDPFRTDLYLRLAELNQKQGLLGNAMAEYRTLVTHYEGKGMVSEAIGVLYRMKEIDPENLNIRVKIIESYLAAQILDKGGEELRETVEFLQGKQDHARLIKICEYFLPQVSEDRNLQVDLAISYLAKGENEKAAQLLEALCQKKEDAEALRLLSQALRQQGDFSREREVHQRRLSLDSGNSEARLGHARASLDLGEYSDALGELEASLDDLLVSGASELRPLYETLKEKLPGNEEIQRSLLKIYERTGEGEKYLDTLSSAPGERVAEEAPAQVLAPDETQEGAGAAPVAETPKPTALEEPEEIPLEFLEGIEVADEPSSEERAAAAPEGGASDPSDSTLELELELELDDDDFEAALGGISGSEEATAQGEGDFFDLRSALLFEEDSEEGSQKSGASEPDGKQKKTGKGIRTDVDVEDPESHYNLGIAYKEMGLLDDAILEFERASSDAGRAVACLTLKGICLTEMGEAAKAEEIFEQALCAPQLEDGEKMGLLYELGLLYENLDRSEEALERFEAVFKQDPFFRDVEVKRVSLRKALGKEEVEEPGSAGEGRVSYL